MPIRYTCPLSSPKTERASRSLGVTVSESWSPSRSTVRASGAPFESRTVCASASQVVVGLPSTASTRSPARSPACSAGEPAETPPTRGSFDGTSAPTVRKSTA